MKIDVYYENKISFTLQQIFKNVGIRLVPALWAFVGAKMWAWHRDEITVSYERVLRICMPNPHFPAFIAFEISTFIRTDGQTDTACSTRLVILKNIVYKR